LQYTFASLDQLSLKAGEIHTAAQTKLMQDALEYPPGLRDQYKLMLERIARGSPGLELMSFPGFASRPNPPKPGKKYLSVLAALNHPFSRGTIVSTDPDCLRPS
jgi:hypothetical protein